MKLEILNNSWLYIFLFMLLSIYLSIYFIISNFEFVNYEFM